MQLELGLVVAADKLSIAPSTSEMKTFYTIKVLLASHHLDQTLTLLKNKELCTRVTHASRLPYLTFTKESPMVASTLSQKLPF